MAMNVLFAAVPVGDLLTAITWYEQLFGRPADIVPNADEAMWQVAANAWLYVINDALRAGNTVVTVCVDDLDRCVAELAERSITGRPIERVGDAGRRAAVSDPDGNVINLIEVIE